jgi:hypothetical protein
MVNAAHPILGGAQPGGTALGASGTIDRGARDRIEVVRLVESA